MDAILAYLKSAPEASGDVVAQHFVSVAPEVKNCLVKESSPPPNDESEQPKTTPAWYFTEGNGDNNHACWVDDGDDDGGDDAACDGRSCTDWAHECLVNDGHESCSDLSATPWCGDNSIGAAQALVECLCVMDHCLTECGALCGSGGENSDSCTTCVEQATTSTQEGSCGLEHTECLNDN